MDWMGCQQNNFVKRKSPDLNLIQAILIASKNKNESQKLLPLTVVTAASKVDLAYGAVRMKLEALAIQNGWKIYGHDCYCAFLKEELHESELGTMFDTLRQVRNGLSYYGVSISVADASVRLAELEMMFAKVNDLVSTLS